MTKAKAENGTFHTDEGADFANQETEYTPPNVPDMSILQASKVQYPDFPLDIFPKPVQDWITIEARLNSCPVAYVVGGLLTSIASLIGTTRQAKAGHSFTVFCILWGAIIGKPSSRKTPSFKACLRLLVKMDIAKQQEFNKGLQEWNEKIERNTIAVKQWKKDVKDDSDNTEPMPKAPPRPLMRQNIANDLTPEMLAVVLQDNQKGVFHYYDELVGMLDMDKYKSGKGGGEKSLFLALKTGAYIKIQRKGKPLDPIILHMAAVCIYGGIQPEKLVELIGGADDGFAARFLLFSGQHVFYKPSDLVQNDDFMVDLFGKLDVFAHAIGDDGKTLKPVTMPLTPEAQKLFDDWYMAHDRKTAALDGKKNSFYGKLGGEALAISIILESMKDVIEGNQSTTISYKSIKNALKAIEFYFMPMIDSVLGGLGDASHVKEARAVAQKILELKPEKVTSTEIRTKWKINGLKTSKDVGVVTEMLVDLNWLDWTDKDSKKGAIRKKEWTVNKLVYRSNASNDTNDQQKGSTEKPNDTQTPSNAQDQSSPENNKAAFESVCRAFEKPESPINTAFGAFGAFETQKGNKKPDIEPEPDTTKRDDFEIFLEC